MFTAIRGGRRVIHRLIWQVFALCHTSCGHPKNSEKLAKRLKLQGPPTTLTVRDITSQQTIDNRTVELNLALVQSSKLRATFIRKLCMTKNFNIGTKNHKRH